MGGLKTGRSLEFQREAAEGGRAGLSGPCHPVPAPPHFWFHKAPTLNTEPENKAKHIFRQQCYNEPQR